MKIFKAEPFYRPSFIERNKVGIDRLFCPEEKLHPGFNRRMFDEDFARLLSSLNQHDGDSFKIESTDEPLTLKLLSNVRTRYSSRSIEKTIIQLVEKVAKSLVFFGRAYYFLYENTEQDEIHIASFRPEGVIALFGRYIQWVPKRRENHWDRDNEEHPREIRILDASKVMRFDIPKAIKKLLSIQNKMLYTLDKHRFENVGFPPTATYENPNPINHFDFSAWNDTQERALYRATRSTGWNGRKYDSTKRSDFFDCHRLIRFRRNQLLLRDSILEQLSHELSKIGKRYNADFSVSISGTDKLPSISHLNELETKLEREEVGFIEVTDYCFKR
ncbi:hypothetical protein [Castellaniella sp.]|uniref:hypothetical protein n=1 Tax=Castellaniella sp. TaxID=1955812 RepID=UPI002B0007CF|nr:hypothetical protein [Castellaniella sp.]